MNRISDAKTKGLRLALLVTLAGACNGPVRTDARSDEPSCACWCHSGTTTLPATTTAPPCTSNSNTNETAYVGWQPLWPPVDSAVRADHAHSGDGSETTSVAPYAGRFYSPHVNLLPDGIIPVFGGSPRCCDDQVAHATIWFWIVEPRSAVTADQLASAAKAILETAAESVALLGQLCRRLLSFSSPASKLAEAAWCVIEPQDPLRVHNPVAVLLSNGRVWAPDKSRICCVHSSSPDRNDH